jgi:hypothetical protein
MMRFLLSFFLKHLDKIIIVLLVASLLGFVYVTGRKHERQVWKPKYDALVEAVEVAKRQAEAEKLAAIQQVKEAGERAVAHLQERVHANAASADVLRNELRRANASRQLKPAQSAPAACGDFEADRTKLPERDQSILVDIGERCNKAAIQANACAEYAVGLHRACSAASP